MLDLLQYSKIAEAGLCDGVLDQIGLVIEILNSSNEDIEGQTTQSIELPTSIASTIPQMPGDQINDEKCLVRFSDIIGNEDAKQALHENVILPLCLDYAQKKKLFSGIRAGDNSALIYRFASCA